MVEILNYRKEDSKDGHVVARFDIQVPEWDGVILRNLCLLRKGNATWITFPKHKVYGDWLPEYYSDIDFDSQVKTMAFFAKVKDALDIYITGDRLLPF